MVVKIGLRYNSFLSGSRLTKKKFAEDKKTTVKLSRTSYFHVFRERATQAKRLQRSMSFGGGRKATG